MDRYYLDNDDDGHWYIIPRNKKTEWDNYINGMLWEGGMDEPEGVIPLNTHPSRVIFKDFIIE